MSFAAFAKFVSDFEVTIKVVLIILITVLVSKLIRNLTSRALEKSTRLVKAEPTEYKFFGHLLSAMVYIFGIGLAVYIVPSLRALSVSLLAGAGVLALVVGFASQQALSNIVSGMFIIFSKPYRVGDMLNIRGSIVGIVEDVTLRHTVIKTFENKRVIVPNSVMNSEIIENANIGELKVCKLIDFGISYDSDIGKAMKIMRDEAMKHPDILDARTEEQKKRKAPVVNVRVVGFGDSSVNLRAWAWAKDPGTGFRMACDLRKSIKERFDKEGVEIPFPYRTIVYKKDMKKSRKLGKKRKR